MVKYSQEMKDYIFANYLGTGHSAMAEKLNKRFGTSITKKQIKTFYHNYKLNSGLTGRFEKGHVPFNKGCKGMCAKGCEKTWFRGGNLPHNTKPIGYERITKDGYVEVKVAMRPSRKDCNDNFILKHRLIWEQHNGPIPKDCVVMFKDGNKQNFDLDNLALITREEHLQLTRRELRSSEAELTETGILIAKTDIAIKNRKKGKKQ